MYTWIGSGDSRKALSLSRFCHCYHRHCVCVFLRLLLYFLDIRIYYTFHLIPGGAFMYMCSLFTFQVNPQSFVFSPYTVQSSCVFTGHFHTLVSKYIYDIELLAFQPCLPVLVFIPCALIFFVRSFAHL